MKNFESILLCFCFFGLGAASFSHQNKSAAGVETVVTIGKPAAPGSGRVFSGGRHGSGGIKNAGIMDIEDPAFGDKFADDQPARTRFSARQNRKKRAVAPASAELAGTGDKTESKPQKIGDPEGTANLPPGIAGLLNI
jgi:hypothetical protein